MKERVHIKQIVKRKDTGWAVHCDSPSSFKTHIVFLSRRNVKIGPRLEKCLSILESKTHEESFVFSLGKKDCTPITREVDGEIVYLEFDIRTVRDIDYDYTSVGSFSTKEVIYDYFKSDNDNSRQGISGTDNCIISYDLSKAEKLIVEADTFKITVNEVGKNIPKELVGKEITVKMFGVSSAKKERYDSSKVKNIKYCQKTGAGYEESWAVAESACTYVEELMKKPNTRFVLDMNLQNGALHVDKAERYYGMVHLVTIPNTEANYLQFLSGAKSINLNKTLLTTKASKPNYRYGIFDSLEQEDVENKFDMGEWEYELMLEENKDLNPGDRLEDKWKDKVSEKEQPDTTTIEVSDPGAKDNMTDFIVPYDDRVMKNQLSIEEYERNVRIGDVMFHIPPQAISLNMSNAIEKVKTLRTRSSMMTKSGSATEILTLQLFFDGLEEINGKEIHGYDIMNGKEKKSILFSVDGLRPLLAQFKKTPFLPIDNEYINDTLGIHEVALYNINISTVPGFPTALSVTLSLAKFELSSYMPQLDFLGRGINYPLLRWFYQDAMIEKTLPNGDRNTTKTYLEPISGEITNQFTFQIANEADLQNKQEKALMFQNKIPSSQFKQDTIGGKTEYGKQLQESKDAGTILGKINKYKEALKTGKITTPEKYKDLSFVEKEKQKNFVDNFMESIYKPKGAGMFEIDPYLEFVVGYHPHFDNIMKKVEKEISNGTSGAKEVKEAIKDNGFFYMVLKSAKHLPLLESVPMMKLESVKGAVGFANIICSADEEGIKLLEAMKKNGYLAESAAMDYVDNYEALKKEVELSEAAVMLIDYNVDGMFVTSMNIVHENVFSNFQMQGLESPTLQFLGGQDPYIQVSMECTEEAVAKIKKMMAQVNRYARDYRVGISSGFFGIRNQIVQMSGINAVMLETMDMSTVPGQPDLFKIEMVLCGFDKTQKRHEKLDGVSGVYAGANKESAKISKVDTKLQDQIVEISMLNSEVYPDLELPEFGHVKNVINYLDCKIDPAKFKNVAGGKYVDPDFYICSDWTYRNQLIYDLENAAGQSISIYDTAGFAAESQVMGKEPIVVSEKSAEDMEKIKNDVPSIPYTAFDEEVPNQEKKEETSSNGPVARINDGKVNDAIVKWLSENKEYTNPPSYEQWKKWYPKDSEETYKKQIVQPSQADVANRIETLFYTYFWNLVRADANTRDKETPFYRNASYKHAAFAEPTELYHAFHDYLRENNPTWKENTDKLRKFNSLKVKEAEAIAPAPRIRIINFIKSIFHYESRWKQFDTNGKPFNIRGEGIYGIAGIDVRHHASTTDEALRFMWDWKYQMDYAIKHMKNYFEVAAKHTEITIAARPWDYMIAAYGNGLLKKEELETAYYKEVIKIFGTTYNGFSKTLATPEKDSDSTIIVNDGAGGQKSPSSYDVAFFISEMERDGFFAHYKGKKEDLLKKSHAEVFEIYLAYYGISAGKNIEFVPDGNGGNAAFNPTGYDGKGRDKQGYALAKELSSSKDIIDNDNALRFNMDPEEVFRAMHIDETKYDMKGRMVRAFPSFQMYIVDEGRYMGFYKMWDNFYGFNAIQSIDVHKSRKSITDTAIITMTNMYSNLTTKSSNVSMDDTAIKFWDNIVFGNPTEEIINSRLDLLDSMMLEAGSRIHLRMGYGSNAATLPIVFNGTITEIDPSEVITLVAQGDGLELTSVISGDPSDDNKRLLWVQEPRDLLCKLLTSKGNFLRDVLNTASEGVFAKDHPLGIVHFGRPKEVTPAGNLFFSNYDYGEAAQNIFSTNNAETHAQWVYEKEGSDANNPFSFDGTKHKWAVNDKDNVALSLYNQTTWDIASTLSYCIPDFIPAVMPFETRSTLFFGKPYYPVAYGYNSKYEWSKEHSQWERKESKELRKPFMQVSHISSYSDIISNNIKATSDGMYTCAVVNYDDKVTMPVYADYDIFASQQRTAVVEANILARFPGLNFFTAERQATYYGMSTVRDYMKDMYGGTLTVMGKPALKPHDCISLDDNHMEMKGTVFVESVVHHFSHETGFITNIVPDANVAIDDKLMTSLSTWIASVGVGSSAGLMGKWVQSTASRMLTNSAFLTKTIEFGKAGSDKAYAKVITSGLDDLPDHSDFKELKKVIDTIKKEKSLKTIGTEKLNKVFDDAIKNSYKWMENQKYTATAKNVLQGEEAALKAQKLNATLKNTKSIMNGAKNGANMFKSVKTLACGIGPGAFLAILAGFAFEVAVSGIAEWWTRKKKAQQCVIMMPLKYRGRKYIAGIRGTKGMVVGDAPGRFDNFMMGNGLMQDGEVKKDDGIADYVVDVLNWISQDNKQFSTSEQQVTGRE